MFSSDQTIDRRKTKGYNTITFGDRQAGASGLHMDEAQQRSCRDLVGTVLTGHAPV
jgi:hypothetical protein